MPTKWGRPNDSPCLACRRQVRIRLGLRFLGLTQSLVPGRDGGSPSGQDQDKIQGQLVGGQQSRAGQVTAHTLPA